MRFSVHILTVLDCAALMLVLAAFLSWSRYRNYGIRVLGRFVQSWRGGHPLGSARYRRGAPHRLCGSRLVASCLAVIGRVRMVADLKSVV